MSGARSAQLGGRVLLCRVGRTAPPTNDGLWGLRDEKVKLLECVKPILKEDLVLGQYVAAGGQVQYYKMLSDCPLSGGTVAGADQRTKGMFMKLFQEGYLDDPGVPNDSKTPTFAMCVLHIDNERWSGVPFIIKAGKVLAADLSGHPVVFQCDIVFLRCL